jgi:ABC-type nitrate/sulfonate/bicarbonate transport system substrate-binding protein
MKKVLWRLIVIGFIFVEAMPVMAETYHIGMLPLIGWAEYRVAKVNGFWEKQGVSVEFLEYDTPLDYIQAISQQRVNIGPMPMAVVADPRNTGNPDLVYLGTLSVADHHKYLIIKKDLVNKPLTGYTIGIFNPDIANTFLLSTYLKTVNTRLEDVTLTPMNTEDLELNFIKGRLQALLALDQGNRFYEQANGVIALSTRDFYEPHGLTISKGLLTAMPPEDLKKILRGCLEAIAWIRDPANWEAYKAILKKYYLTGLVNPSDDQIRQLAQEGKFFDPQTLLAHNEKDLPAYFTQLRDFIAAQGALQPGVLKAFTYENVIANQTLIEVLQEYVK